MERGQFYHYETYGRKVSKAKKKKNSSLYSVLGEAFREPEFSSHVKKIDTDEHPPEIVYTDMLFKEGLGYKERLETQKTHLIKLAESYAKKKKLRLIDGCILSGIVSYPPGTTLEMLFFLRANFVIPFLKKKWGKNLRCIIGHNDEYFWDDVEKKREVHYQDHFYVILDDQSDNRLTNLHAGRAAKNKALANEIVLKEEEGQWIDKKGKFVMKTQPIPPKKDKEKENSNKHGKGLHCDRAYRDAMRQEQDEFYLAVGEPAGWERTTVNGIRYPREQVKAWKHNQREMEAKEEAVKEEVERQKKEAKEIKNKAEAEAENAKKQALDTLIMEGEKIINNTKEEAEVIKNKTKKEAEEIKKQAEKEAKETQDKAWKKAAEIENAAKDQAASILKKSEKFVDMLLEKISKLPGSSVIIDWVKTFRKDVLPNKKNEETVKNDGIKKTHTFKP
jgi:DNA segregation ATPase FtsK/SpoIIIE-like protein